MRTESRPFSRVSVALAVSVLSGVTLSVAAAPRNLPTLAFFSAPLLLIALEYAVTTRRPHRTSFLLGWLTGSVANAIALYWIVGLLERFGGFPLAAAIPVAILLFAAQGLTFAFAAWIASALMTRGAEGYWVLPVSLTVIFAWSPGLFHWHPCVPLVSFLPYVQLAELGGQPLLDLAWAASGCGLYIALRDLPFRKHVHARRRFFIATAWGLTCALLPPIYGIIRLEQVDAERASAPGRRVGVVQPNIGIHEKHDPLLWAEHVEQLQAATFELEQEGADFSVWPESAYAYPIRRIAVTRARGPDEERPFEAYSVRGRRAGPLVSGRRDTPGFERPLLFGAVTTHSRCERYNSVVAMDEQGRFVGYSDKVELLAFGEYVPLWDFIPPLQEAFPCRGFSPGARPQVVTLANTRVGVLNCYEDVLAEHARTVALDYPDMLVNVTNDAWFGDTDEPHLHHQFARLRAIETRRDLVRAVNTGVSGHILATGESRHSTATFTPDAFVAEVRLLSGTTLWTRLGDVVSPSLFALLLVSVVQRRKRTKGR